VALYRSRPDGSPRNTWPLTVAALELAGQTARVRCTGPLDLTAEITAASVASLRLHPGEPVWASVKASEVSAYPA
jgi:molybdate transport system ATP-binding protein